MGVNALWVIEGGAWATVGQKLNLTKAQNQAMMETDYFSACNDLSIA